jgi:hypothetical protein
MYLDYSIQDTLWASLYPRVLHCRIVPIEKLKTLVPDGRKNPPVNHLGSK